MFVGICLLIVTGQGSAGDTSNYKATAREHYRRNKVWVVPANMADKAGLAIVASGSDVVAVHTPNGASDFPNERLIRNFNAAPGSPGFDFFSFSCLGLPPRADMALGMDLRPYQEVSHIPITAIAAMPYLRHHAICLDPANGIIDVVSSPTPPAEGVRLDIEWKNDLACVPVDLPVLGRRPFILDTGSTGLISISSDRAQALERMGYLISVMSVPRVDLNLVDRTKHSSTQKEYVLRWMEFAGIRFRNVPVEIRQDDRAGLGLLRYFRTTMDFPNSSVWVQRNGSTEAIDPPMSASGLTLGFYDADRLVVDFVIDGFVGQRSGIEVGDQILKFDGRTPAELSSSEILEISSQSGKVVPLDVKRKDRVFHVDIALEHPFRWPPAWPAEPPTFDPDVALKP